MPKFNSTKPVSTAAAMSGGFEDLGLLPELVRAVTEMGWL